jgi:hypothetical protein
VGKKEGVSGKKLLTIALFSPHLRVYPSPYFPLSLYETVATIHLTTDYQAAAVNVIRPAFGRTSW